MKKFINIAIILFVLIISTSCSKNNTNITTQENNESPEDLFKLAMIELDNKNYDIAQEKFQEIESIFPLSNEAVESQIMDAFIEYIKMNYTESIFKFNRIINNYPSHKNLDYTYYMRAMCYFEQIENEYLDGNNNIKALENFEQIINRFPDSKYARDSEQKIIFINENIAAKHMDIAFFYLNQKKYLASMKRYKKVIDDHSESKFTPEALHRLVEIYYKLGMIQDAEKTTAVLGYNYPKSKLYQYSYNLIRPNEEKNNFLKKISNFMNKDNE